MMTAERFAEYTEELRQFSVSHGVRWGAPEDLPGLVEALEGGGAFAEECASMFRSVVYRERGEADAVSLLMLLTYAWGGMTEPEEGTVSAEPVLELWEFVRAAMRAPQLREMETAGEEVFVAAGCPEVAVAVTDDGAGMRPRTLFEVEGALRELEAGSVEVRMYRELLQQQDSMLEVWRANEALPREVAAVAGAEDEGRVQAARAREDDPWDENSELQQELRRFAAHRERMLAREAEKAARPLHAKLLGGAESVLGHWLGGGRGERRGLGSH